MTDYFKSAPWIIDLTDLAMEMHPNMVVISDAKGAPVAFIPVHRDDYQKIAEALKELPRMLALIRAFADLPDDFFTADQREEIMGVLTSACGGNQ